MRVFHFVDRDYGLDDLRRKRLKIATLDELNDPFELFGINLSDAGLRHAFRRMKEQMAVNRGLLCFSRNWRNPVQWSHYAGKHTGLCLGFEIPDVHLGAVNYSARRLVVEANRFLNPREIDEATVTKYPFTKFSHWRYENEVRSFATLEDRDFSTGLYFAEFSDQLKLVQVIVGAMSTLTRGELQDALGNLGPAVDAFKARLAFGSFAVVRQRKGSLWP